MKSENGIVILIGNNGCSFFVKNSKETKSSFIEVLNDEAKQKLEPILQENANLPIYILLDTADQSYKKKIYPSMKAADFERVAKRDLATEGDKDAIKNYITLKNRNQKSNSAGLKKAGESKKVECMFITCNSSNIINAWLDFIALMPNRLYGIYMFPLETASLHKLMHGFIKSNFKNEDKKDLDITCIIAQTKCGGTRQMVFSDNGLIFTRAVNYNFTEKSFSDKYFQDLMSTFEYLKRLYVDLSIIDFKIINLLPESYSQFITSNKVINANYVNCSPEEMASHIGIKENDLFFVNHIDYLSARTFLNSKKILKFSNIKIKIFDSFYSMLMLSKAVTFLLGSILIATIIFILLSVNFSDENIKNSEIEKVQAEAKLKTVKESSSDYKESSSNGIEIGVKEVVEIGKVNDAFGKYIAKPWNSYYKFDFLSNSGVKIEKMSYELTGKIPIELNKKMSLSGLLLNDSGDIDGLFKKYDILIDNASKALGSPKDEKYSFSDLPKNIDFNKKYYDFPIEAILENNK